MTLYRFDPVDLEQMRLRGRLSPGQRILAMLDARELAVGLIRGRLRRQHPDLSPRELNLKVLQELARVQRTSPGPSPFSGHSGDVGGHQRAQLDRSQLDRLSEEPERHAHITSAEDILLIKLEWYRIGGEISDWGWCDVLGVLQVRGDRFDDGYLHHMAAALVVTDLLERPSKATG